MPGTSQARPAHAPVAGSPKSPRGTTAPSQFLSAVQRMMTLRRRLPGQKEGGLAPFITRPMGIALGSCLLPPPPPSWQPPLCCQAQANFPLVRGKAFRSTCYGFIQYSFNHILKCEINGSVYIPLFFIRNKFIFTLGMQLNTSHEEAQFLKASTFYAGRALHSYPLIRCNIDHSKACDSLIKANTMANKQNP